MVSGGCRCKSRQPGLVGNNAIQRYTFLPMAGPAYEGRHAIGTFPIGILLTAERCSACVGLGVVVRTIVRRVHHQRVISDAQFIQQRQELSDMHIVLDHSIGILVLT